jgi:hypothetical protein
MQGMPPRLSTIPTQKDPASSYTVDDAITPWRDAFAEEITRPPPSAEAYENRPPRQNPS